MKSLDIDQLVQQILSDLNRTATSAFADTAVGSAFIGNRVISIADIKTQSDNVRTLFILPKAVLTPSAKDEIRKRRIKIAVRLDSRSVADNSGETACIESASVNVSAFIGSRVVSAADIQTQPGSVRTLFILPKAVLTPSAKDEIRKRRITIAVQ